MNKRKQKKRIKKNIFKVLFLFFIIFCLALAMLSINALKTDVADYKYEPKGKTLIYSSDNVLIAQIYDENRTYVETDKVSKDFLNAVVAVEDKTFYTHHGVSIKGVTRAVVNNIMRKNAYSEGGSTITQQVVKRLFLSDKKSYVRKLNEAILALKMERVFSKDEILEIYINHMYLGAGTYGVQEASKKYFGIDAKDLNIAQSALIAGLFQAPSAFCPFDNYDEAISRQHQVINSMVEVGYLTEEKAQEAKNMKINLAKNTGFPGTSRQYTDAFIDYVIDEYYNKIIPVIQNKYSMDYENAKLLAQRYLNYEGITIKTTLNYKAQLDAVASINSVLKSSGLANKATGAIVSIDYKTGSIRTYWGGKTKIDMASSPRQPGSSIKPFYYAAAIEEGQITPRTMINDDKTSWGSYTPRNYDGKYRGWMSVRSALVASRNIPSVKIFDNYGITRSMEAIKSYGFTTIKETDYNLASSLGGLTYGVKPVEMANAYCAFANDGLISERYSIESVVDKNGSELFNINDIELKKTRVFGISTANMMNGMLRDVVSYGTGTAARVYSYPAAGKTGTTENHKDLWFVGYCAGLSTAVWLGDPDMGEIGGSSYYSANAFAKYYNSIINDGTLSKMITYLNQIEAKSSMINIKVAKNKNSNEVYYNEDEVESIWISESEYNLYEDLMVKKVTIDSSTLKLFVDGNCPVEYKKTVYFLLDQVPTESCSKFHYIDKIFNNFEKPDKRNKPNRKNN